MPAIGYAVAGLASDRVEQFLLLLYGHAANYQGRGSFFTTEQQSLYQDTSQPSWRASLGEIQVRNTALICHTLSLSLEQRSFAKAGSGQTQGKVETRGRFRTGLVLHAFADAGGIDDRDAGDTSTFFSHWLSHSYEPRSFGKTGSPPTQHNKTKHKGPLLLTACFGGA